MSDAYRRYRAIRQALMQCFPVRSHSRAEQHLNTLTMLICGIVGSEQVHLPRIADHAPGGHTAHESQVIRYRRWLMNESIGIQELDAAGGASAAARLGSAAATLGHGWQHGRTWLHVLDGERGLPRAGFAAGLDGG